MRADLHVHSTASDGTLSPSELVARAHANHVDVLALADHDSIDGLAEAHDAADPLKMRLVNAVELSAVSDTRDIHVLAYFVDPGDRHLNELLKTLRDARRERAEVMVTELNRAGYDVSFEDVLAIADGGALGRSHVARALVGAGHSDSIQHAFETFIGRDRPFYVRKHSASPNEVIAKIRDLNAIPVIAHPGITAVDDLIPEMVADGLLGIEAYHGDHTPEQTRHYVDLAALHNLLVTGGSDFHGPGAPNPDIGSVDVPTNHVEALLDVGTRL